MAVRDEILKMNPKFQEFNNALHCKAVGNRHIPHTGRNAGWSISYGKGCGDIWPPTYVFIPAIPLIGIYEN